MSKLGIRVGELNVITSATGGTYNVDLLDKLKLIHYSCELDWATHDRNSFEIHTWLVNNIGEKYATWTRSINKYTFYKDEHRIRFMLTWGYDN